MNTVGKIGLSLGTIGIGVLGVKIYQRKKKAAALAQEKEILIAERKANSKENLKTALNLYTGKTFLTGLLNGLKKK